MGGILSTNGGMGKNFIHEWHEWHEWGNVYHVIRVIRVIRGEKKTEERD
ncbi:MAG: hypothetical protein LBT24_00065 [Tannerella sp.]|nr:hypothetical protein [Tannerella sp.]